jgi:hypothetical protein
MRLNPAVCREQTNLELGWGDPMFDGVILALAMATGCEPLPGEAALWANPETRYVLVGEGHGTAEIPIFFADLVCAAHLSGRPVVVGVEANEKGQPDIDQFLDSDGGDAARAAFLRSSIWQVRDGRASRAYFALFERLRRYKQSGQIADVVATQPAWNPAWAGHQSESDEAMADRLQGAAARRPGAILFVLAGNVHASKGAFRFGDETVVPAGANLPPRQTISLNILSGGQAWNCSEAHCGPRQYGSAAPGRRGVRLVPYEPPKYDGVAELGVPTTASPPELP